MDQNPVPGWITRPQNVSWTTSTEPDPWADLPAALRLLKPAELPVFEAQGEAWNLVVRFCQSHRDLDQ